MEDAKPAAHNTENETSVSTKESGGSQNCRHHELTSGQTQPSCSETEAPDRIPTEGEIMRLIASKYLQATPPRSKDDLENFLTYMKEMRQVFITGVDIGSLLITVKCDSLEVLEGLWEDYSSGHLGEVVQKCFVTDEILKELSLAELKLKTTISEEEYQQCKAYLEKKG